MPPALPPLPARHLLLGLLVVAVWGSNFVVIESALAHLPPLFLAFLRFALAFLPAALFVPRPAVPLGQLAAYGVLIGAGQFGLLFVAMTDHISPGLASLVIQTQVFFTIVLAALLAAERVAPVQWAGLGCAAAGLALIAAQGDARATPLGLALVLAAAASWAAANLVGRRAGRVDMLGYMVWSSAFALPPLLALSLLFEGPAAITTGLRAADLGTALAVLWQAVGNTLLGYGAWGWLLARHPAAQVVPLALGVPVFGLAAAALWLGEPLPAWLLGAAALVLAGMALTLLGPRWLPAAAPPSR